MKPKQPIIPNLGNHIPKLQEGLKSNPVWPGSVNHVAVLHDEWCDLLTGKGPCNCNPEIEIMGREQ
jgi:hypothetical protein